MLDLRKNHISDIHKNTYISHNTYHIKTRPIKLLKTIFPILQAQNLQKKSKETKWAKGFSSYLVYYNLT